jgi:hypothetical protein
VFMICQEMLKNGWEQDFSTIPTFSRAEFLFRSVISEQFAAEVGKHQEGL